jgi:2-deoxy-D-gluconate 3-dehydrogenase
MSNLFDLTGKVSIVTGGNSGIGKGIAIGLAEHGSDIVIAARNQEKTENVVKEILSMGRRCIGVQCDVLERRDIVKTVDTAVNELGKLNILVNNAGLGQGGERTEEIAFETWQKVIDTNLTAPFVFCQVAYPALVKSGGGKIINIGSGFSHRAAAGNAAYAASKAGLWNMTRSMALDWGKDNIQVTMISPGWIRTEMAAGELAGTEQTNRILSETPAGRIGDLEEVAGAAVFLASGASDFVTGSHIKVDGGKNAGIMPLPWPPSPDQQG